VSTYLVLKEWMGNDPAAAAGHLARLFRMDPEDARQAVAQVQNGGKWRFDHPIAEAQAQIAQSFLAELGFRVQRESPAAFVRLEERVPETLPESEEEISEEALAAEEAEYLRADSSLVLIFQGDVWDLMALYLKNWLLTVVTLGGWFFKGRTDVRRYLWSHTSLGGDPFQYNGRAWELAESSLKAGAVLLLAVAGLFWIYRHDPLLVPLVQYTILAGCIGALPALWVNSRRYRLACTTWQGIRFDFQGTRTQATWLYLKGWLLLALTLGLYLPVFVMQTAAFWRSQTTFGKKTFRFSGKWQEVARDYGAAWVATVLTLGLALPCWLWVAARTQRYLWKHTHFEGGVFEYTATPGQYALHWCANAGILLFTLGLGYPWVVERNLIFCARHLTFEGLPHWNQLLRQMRPAAARPTGMTAGRPRYQPA